MYECNTRIIWTDKAVAADDVLETGEFVIWHPDEATPEGELNSDKEKNGE